MTRATQTSYSVLDEDIPVNLTWLAAILEAAFADGLRYMAHSPPPHLTPVIRPGLSDLRLIIATPGEYHGDSSLALHHWIKHLTLRMVLLSDAGNASQWPLPKGCLAANMCLKGKPSEREGGVRPQFTLKSESCLMHPMFLLRTSKDLREAENKAKASEKVSYVIVDFLLVSQKYDTLQFIGQALKTAR